MDSNQTNRHGEAPFPSMTKKRNTAKAVYSMLGLCCGLVADNRISEQELIFLQNWLSNNAFLADDPDAVDILDLIEDILEDQVITSAELEDLKELLLSILEYRHAAEIANPGDCIDALLGLLQGITADRVIVDLEVFYLKAWLKLHADICDIWPANIVAKRVRGILADGKVSHTDKLDLMGTLDKISGANYTEYGTAEAGPTTMPLQDVDTITHRHSSFCFSGRFISGTRRDVEHKARRMGALVHARVTKNLDYLVIGTLASRDWKHTSHGNKIAKAIEHQEAGLRLLIISERTWCKYCE